MVLFDVHKDHVNVHIKKVSKGIRMLLLLFVFIVTEGQRVDQDTKQDRDGLSMLSEFS